MPDAFLLSTILFLLIDTEIAFADFSVVFSYARLLAFGLLAAFLAPAEIGAAFIALLVMVAVAFVSGVIYFSSWDWRQTLYRYTGVYC